MGDVRVTTINLARTDNSDRRFLFFHGPYLHGRGVGPQDHIVRKIECVLHVPRRMVLGNIQGFEIIVIQLDFRPFGQLKAQTGEDLYQLIRHPVQNVRAAKGHPPARKGHVHIFRSQFTAFLFLLERSLFAVEFPLQFGLDFIGELPHFRAFLRGQVFQTPQKGRQLALSPERTRPDFRQIFGVVKLGDS